MPPVPSGEEPAPKQPPPGFTGKKAPVPKSAYSEMTSNIDQRIGHLVHALSSVRPASRTEFEQMRIWMIRFAEHMTTTDVGRLGFAARTVSSASIDSFMDEFNRMRLRLKEEKKAAEERK